MDPRLGQLSASSVDERHATLGRVQEELARAPSLTAGFATFARGALELVGADGSALLRFDEGRGVVMAAQGWARRVLPPGSAIPRSELVSGLFSAVRPVVIRPPATSEGILGEAYRNGVRVWATVPVASPDQSLGAIALTWSSPSRFSVDDLELVEEDVRLQSEPGEGSTFTVLLPIGTHRAEP